MLNSTGFATGSTKSIKRLLITVRLRKREALALVAKQDAVEVESDLWAVLP